MSKLLVSTALLTAAVFSSACATREPPLPKLNSYGIMYRDFTTGQIKLKHIAPVQVEYSMPEIQCEDTGASKIKVCAEKKEYPHGVR